MQRGYGTLALQAAFRLPPAWEKALGAPCRGEHTSLGEGRHASCSCPLRTFGRSDGVELWRILGRPSAPLQGSSPECEGHKDVVWDVIRTPDPVSACWDEPKARVISRMAEHHNAVVVRMPAMFQAVLHHEGASALPLEGRENSQRPETNDGASMPSRRNPDRAEQAMPHNRGVPRCHQGAEHLSPRAECLYKVCFRRTTECLLCDRSNRLDVCGLLLTYNDHFLSFSFGT